MDAGNGDKVVFCLERLPLLVWGFTQKIKGPAVRFKCTNFTPTIVFMIFCCNGQSDTGIYPLILASYMQ